MEFIKCLEKYKYTHMPYVFYKDNEQKILFTVIQNQQFWKLYFYDGKKCYKIKTDLDKILGTNRYQMCQPCCHIENGKYCLSFCIQLNNQISLYYIQTDDIINLEGKQIKKIVSNISGGCVTQTKIIVGINNQNFYIFNKNIINNFDLKNFQKCFICKKRALARLSYLNGNENILLISWSTILDDFNCGTIFFNMQTNQQKILLNQKNKSMYKMSIDPLTNQVYYGQKIGLGFEQRKIRKTTLNNINVINGQFINEIK